MPKKSSTTQHTSPARSKKAAPPRPQKTTAAKRARSSHTAAPRRLAAARRVWNKPRTWRTRSVTYAPLPKARHILTQSLRPLLSARKTTLGVSSVYIVGSLLLVRGFSAGQDMVTLRMLLDSLLHGASGKVQSLFLQLSFLFGSSNQSSTALGSLYQSILLLICSLAFIRVLRQVQARQAVSVRDAFYRGMYPLIPFLLVLCIIGIQLLPFAGGSFVLSLVLNQGIAVHAWEQTLFVLLCAALSLWSLRMLTSSVFALYIVTLPDMTPLRAVRSAAQLVKGRRLLIWRKAMLLPVSIIVGTSIIILPFLLFLTPVVMWLFFVISGLWLGVIHSYLYTLYREMLREKT